MSVWPKTLPSNAGSIHNTKSGKSPSNNMSDMNYNKFFKTPEANLVDFSIDMHDEKHKLTIKIPHFRTQSLDLEVHSSGLMKRKSEKKEEKKKAVISLKKTNENINYSSMYELIDDEVQDTSLINWDNVDVYVEASETPFVEPEDLPNVIRWADFRTEEDQFCRLGGEALAKFLDQWKFIESKEDTRYKHANSSGGKQPENPRIMEKMRVLAKEFIYTMGKQVLSGKLNLTTVPFPIKAMVPKSILENVACYPTSFFPLYLNLAMKNEDPLQRFKFYMVANICYFYLTKSFCKPLNPILGETMIGNYPDGSKLYVEQVSHHPPISYVLYHGPKEAYKFWGPSVFSATAGLNSLLLLAKGWRKIQFKDTKQTIRSTFPNEQYNKTLWGSCTQESVGEMEFKDEGNRIESKVVFNNVKKKATDYFEAEIKVDGKVVSKIAGTYLGWIEIDGVRYFDHRYCIPFELQKEKPILQSDFQTRADIIHLELGNFEKAQQEKDVLENLQRHDRKLRKKDH